MTWRATHLLHPEKIRTVKRTSKNTREGQSRTSENTREEHSIRSENTTEEHSIRSENTKEEQSRMERTSKLSPVETKSEEKIFFLKFKNHLTKIKK